MNDTERFWKRVHIGTPDECWPWVGYCSPDGYGHVGVRGRGVVGAYRRAYELTYGPVPKGMEVCHHCDNPPCCNPAHLFMGTHRDNIVDMYSKGRVNRLRGDDHPARKHPERVARGDRSGSRTHPEKRPRGEAHWMHRHPEKVLRAEQNPNAHLTEQQVLDIRARYAAGGTSLPKLAREYGVGVSTVHRIIHRLSWSTV